MKCPHCFCNYDDSERECPMCGRRAGAAVRRNTKRAEARPIPYRPAGRTGRSTGSTGGRRTGGSTWRAPAARQKKPRSRVITAVVLAFVLFLVLPLLTEAALESGGSGTVWQFSDEGFSFSAKAPEYPAPADGPEPEEETPLDDEAIPSGQYVAPGVSLRLEPDWTYRLDLEDSDLSEEGEFYLTYLDPDKDASLYPEEFPPEVYDGYWFLLWGENDSSTAVLYYDTDEADGFYLYNMYARIPWLPLDHAVRFEYAGS